MLPSFASPLEDPIFLIPPMGRPYSLSDEDEPVMRSFVGHPRNSARPSHQQPLLKDRVSELKAQAAAEVCANACRTPSLTNNCLDTWELRIVLQ